MGIIQSLSYENIVEPAILVEILLSSVGCCDSSQDLGLCHLLYPWVIAPIPMNLKSIHVLRLSIFTPSHTFPPLYHQDGVLIQWSSSPMSRACSIHSITTFLK